MKFIKKHRSIVILLSVFALIYASITFVNHYFFRTYALDLGAYTNALYDYRNFQWNDSTVFKEIGENLLSDHFDVYLILAAPLSFLFGTSTLLVVQFLMMLLGGLGVYTYFNSFSEGKKVAIWAALSFLSFFGVFAAFSFDYHSNVVATCLIPWFFHFVKSSQYGKAILFFFLIIVGKENMALFLTFICLGLAFEYRSEVFKRNLLLLGTIFGFASFFIITTTIMPTFANSGGYPHFHYSFLGANFSEAILHILKHPIDSFQVLFINHNDSISSDFIKLETHILVFFSGLYLLVRKPQYLLMLIPIYFQKMFHDNSGMWGIGGQYSIEFAPILAIGAFEVIKDFCSSRISNVFTALVVVGTIGATFRSMDETECWTDKTRIRFYDAQHYQSDVNINKIRIELNKIPKNAVVSAQTSILPQLALRESIYQFPMVKDAKFIVLCSKFNTYPFPQNEFDSLIITFKQSPDWQKISDGELLILRKIAH